MLRKMTRGGNTLKNSKIISASPYRAVIRKVPGAIDDRDSSDDEGQNMQQIDPKPLVEDEED